MNKPQIIHVIDSVTTGGAEILLKNSINILPEFRHLIVHLFPVITLQSSFKGDVEFTCLHHTGWAGIFNTVSKLRRIIKQQRPKLVHSHLLLSNLIARLSTPSSIPLYNSLHSTYSVDAFQKNRKSIWVERLTLRNTHHLVAVSDYVLQDYKQFVSFKGGSFVLYNFLPDQFYSESCLGKVDESAKELRCIAVGSLKEAKNYHYLFDIFSHVKNKNILLDVFGEGALRKELQDRIDAEKLKIRLCGNADISPNLFNNYDLFVQASSHEGFGLSVIEAMASKLPVYISDLPVFREVTGSFAHFFSLEKLPDAVDGLEKMYRNAPMRKQFVEKGYEYCRSNYSSAAYRQKLLSIYNSSVQL